MITNRTYGMDNDVLAYNARIVSAGNQSLSMQSLRQLNQFVISIKKMNLWASMICWPLRANQNSGNGNIVYSLGGLGIYNGTIFGSPIWASNGIIYTATGQDIDFGNIDFGSSTFLYAANPSWSTLANVGDANFSFASHLIGGSTAIKSRSFNIANNNMSGNPNAKDATIELVDYSSGSFGYGGQQNFTSLLTRNMFTMGAMQANGNIYKFYRAGILLSTTTGNKDFDIPANGSNYSGTRKTRFYSTLNNSASGQTLQVPILCLIKSQLTNDAHIQFYSLYKSTLGQDLGLL